MLLIAVGLYRFMSFAGTQRRHDVTASDLATCAAPALVLMRIAPPAGYIPVGRPTKVDRLVAPHHMFFVPLMIAQRCWKRANGIEWPAVVWVPVLFGWLIVVVVIHRLVQLAF